MFVSFNRDDYTSAITKEQIGEFTHSNTNVVDTAKIIQIVKEDIVSKIRACVDGDGDLIADAEDFYLQALESLGISMSKEAKDNYVSQLKLSIENMSEPQTETHLGKKGGYIGDYDRFSFILSKYILSKTSKLEKTSNDSTAPGKERDEIKWFLKVMNNENIENTKKRTLSFDEEKFKNGIGNATAIKNIECFYERDFKGKKNYFSLNTLLNYTDTFGVELGLTEIDLDTLPEKIRKKHFPSINKKLKLSSYKNILAGLRDKQEVLMYGFKDYEKQKSEVNDLKRGFMAEKVVELQFRELAASSNYDISIVRSSIGEDQGNSTDLFIILQDKKTGVSIKEELQITLKEDTVFKKQQIENRNNTLSQQEGNTTESQLITFSMMNLEKSMRAWRYFNRPIGKLPDTLNLADTKMIEETFNRLVTELQAKV